MINRIQRRYERLIRLARARFAPDSAWSGTVRLDESPARRTVRRPQRTESQ